MFVQASQKFCAFIISGAGAKPNQDDAGETARTGVPILKSGRAVSAKSDESAVEMLWRRIRSCAQVASFATTCRDSPSEALHLLHFQHTFWDS